MAAPELDDLSPAHPMLGFSPIERPRHAPPLLFIVVDTEEEFDWRTPFARDNTSTTAIRRLENLQSLLDRFHLRPTYVIDYPVATQAEAYKVIRSLAASGRCDVGAHLHPWVTPPFTEEVTERNSFACNLGETIEEAKLRMLTDAIERHIGIRPRIYKAGRYGFGPSTIAILQRLGFRIDISINPLMDYRSGHGPNFEAFDARPFFFGNGDRLLEVPCTHGFTGCARRVGPALHRLSESPALRLLRLNGVLCRAGALNKVMLSPETSTLEEMRSVTRTLLADGIRTFTMTFHSPSLAPGHTPYVRSSEDLRQFLRRTASFCDYFLGTLGGVPGTLEEFRSSLMAGGAAA